MSRTYEARKLIGVFFTLGVGLFVGCGGESTAVDCEEGTRQSCSCDDSSTGFQLCSAAGWSSCECGICQPEVEICDGIDNDCDGLVDNGIAGVGETCSVAGAQGVCAVGERRCDGVGLVCEQAVFPSDEVCNGLDDDCDGLVDEDLGVVACSVSGQQGPCGTGEGRCIDGTLECTQLVFPEPEICDDIDNDCNGAIDDGNPGGGGSCLLEDLRGPCAVGQRECQNGSVVCTQLVFPEPEICDGIDNDCDSTLDNGNPGGGGGCLVPGLAGECVNGVQACQYGGLVCLQTVFPVSEICGDGLDNDCDGTADEASAGCQCTPSSTQPCGSDVGYCISGTQTCLANGTWDPTCVGQRLPTTETCNSIDDDCDGIVDQSVTQACYTGSAASRGVGRCSDGVQTCTAGSWGGCVGETLPTTEVCNGEDDDCDGQTDESGVWPTTWLWHLEPNDQYNVNPYDMGDFGAWNTTWHINGHFGSSGDVDNFYWNLQNYNQTYTTLWWWCEVTGLTPGQTVRIRVGVHTGGYPGAGPWQFSSYDTAGGGNGHWTQIAFPSPQGPYGFLGGVDMKSGFTACSNQSYTLTCALRTTP